MPQKKAKSPAKTEDEQVTPPKSEVDDTLNDAVDGILDEIDEVLEADAEEFVRGYIQKGGQAITLGDVLRKLLGGGLAPAF